MSAIEESKIFSSQLFKESHSNGGLHFSGLYHKKGSEIYVDYLLCECGRYIHKYHMSRHLGAKTHITLLQKQKELRNRADTIKC